MGLVATDPAAVVVQLLFPIGATSFWRQIENVPERLDRASMAGILSRTSSGVEHLGTPEVADLSAVSPEHIQHRQLEPLGRLRVIIPFEVVAGCR